MSLLLQVRSLAISFIYGMFFCFTFFLNKNIFLNKKNIFNILISILFVIDHIFLYFILLRIINNSILHIYFFFSFLLGIYVYIKLFNKID